MVNNKVKDPKKRRIQKRQMPLMSTEHELRNYSDAVGMFSVFQKSGWSAAVSRTERVCSQTCMPSDLLADSLFIDKMIPDELHCILNETRVKNLYKELNRNNYHTNTMTLSLIS